MRLQKRSNANVKHGQRMDFKHARRKLHEIVVIFIYMNCENASEILYNLSKNIGENVDGEKETGNL